MTREVDIQAALESVGVTPEQWASVKAYVMSVPCCRRDLAKRLLNRMDRKLRLRERRAIVKDLLGW